MTWVTDKKVSAFGFSALIGRSRCVRAGGPAHYGTVTQPEPPYSQRDPYWGIDEYGRPISYGRPSLYGSPHPIDPEQLAEQVTFLQPRREEPAIDPAAFAAPSVYRPNWPFDADHSSGYFPTVAAGDEQATDVEPLAGEQVTAAELPIGDQVTAVELPVAEQRSTAEPPIGDPALGQPALGQPLQEYFPPVEPPVGLEPRPFSPAFAPPVVPPNSGRRRLWWIGIGIVVLALVTGVAFAAFGMDAAKRDDDGDALHLAWRTPARQLVLDTIAIEKTLVSVECDAATTSDQQAKTFRTRENPDSCALVGRNIGSGQPRWQLDRQPIGVLLASVGPTVVAYGGPQALVVKAASGEVTRSLPDAVLLGHADTVAVFSERTGPGTVRAVAIDVVDGREIWSAPVAENLAAAHAQSVRNSATTLPSGFDRMFYDRVAHDDAYVLLPESKPAPTLRIREIRTGDVAAAPDEDNQIVGLASGVSLSIAEDDSRKLRGEKLGDSSSGGGWEYDLAAGEEVKACSGLVCVRNDAKNTTVVLDPAKGTVVSRNDSGRLYVRHTGGVAAIMRCANDKPESMCSAQASSVEVVVVSTAKTVWRGRVPAFAAVAAASDGAKNTTRLLVGAVESNEERVEITAFTTDGKATTLGSIDMRAWSSVPLLTAQNGPQPTMVPDLSCTAVDRTVACGKRWTASRTAAWQFEVGR